MNIKRILLISPPAFASHLGDITPTAPMGLGYLAAMIENLNIEVNILDCLAVGLNYKEELNDNILRIGLPDNEIQRYVNDFNPDIIGINCQFSMEHKMYHYMLSLFKTINPKCITVAGGAHVTVCPEDVLRNPSCDFVILGEGEDSFKDLILGFIRNDDISYIDGLGRKKNGKIIINEKRKWIKELDLIAFPAYHLMELQRYFGFKESHGTRHRIKYCPIITSRGCPAKCTFCTAKRVWGEKYRMRSVDNVLKEMRMLKDKYGVEEIMFEDDNVTANPKRAKELFSRMIEEDFNFVWDTPNGIGVWSVDKDMIDLMKQSGAININFPIESGSQFVIDNIIKKPVKLTKVKILAEYCKKINMDYSFFLVIGMPGEKIEDMWKSYRFSADCGCYSPHVSVATPYYGSQLFEECKKNGYFSKEIIFDDMHPRSYLIKTKDWAEKDIRRMLVKGRLYLLYRMLVDDPVRFIRWIVSKKVPGIINGIQNILKPLQNI